MVLLAIGCEEVRRDGLCVGVGEKDLLADFGYGSGDINSKVLLLQILERLKRRSQQRIRRRCNLLGRYW